MDTIAELHAKARKLAALIELQLETPSASPEGRQALGSNLNSLFSTVSLLERAIESPATDNTSETTTSRSLWRRRLVQLQEDSLQLRKTVEQQLRRSFERARVDLDRAELLGVGHSAQQAVVVDTLARERTSITSSAHLVEDFTGLAGNILEALRGQRGVLKGAHRKVLDVSATLGLSSSLMRVISRRTIADKILVYGGVSVILLVVFLFYWLG